MDNKVLVTIIVPLIEKKYEVFLPANKKIGEIVSLLSKGLVEVSNGYYIITNKEKLYNRMTGKEYNNNQILKNTHWSSSPTAIISSSLNAISY